MAATTTHGMAKDRTCALCCVTDTGFPLITEDNAFIYPHRISLFSSECFID